MTTDIGDQLVRDYLARLDRMAHQLPKYRRVELVQEISQHIASARAAGTAEETSVRGVLGRLGEPAEIVAAALRDGAPGPPTDHPPVGTGLEIATVGMFAVGSLAGLAIPTVGLLGWIVGVVLLWTSRQWRRPEKTVGTASVFGAVGLAVLVGALSPQSCTASQSGVAGQPATPAAEQCTGGVLPGTVGFVLYLGLLITPVVASLVLLRRVRRRTRRAGPLDA
ncbi:MAG: hypothetical protein HYR62_05650 [Actinobacteria bacterium]|nr:hypothetical protein [Actinomycetota bacterium]MBI3688524.1 hypothetical protein [Actinomycetota bacterium]